MQRIALPFARRQIGRRPRPLERLRRAGAVPLLCCSVLLAAPSCRPAQRPPALATGERPVTGVERYDHFFSDIDAARVAVEEARSEESEARRALARRVGLPEAAAIDVIGARLRERTARWATEGLTLELELTGIEDTPEDVASDTGDAGGAAGGAAPDGPATGAAADGSADAAPSATLRTPGREPQRRELRLLEALAQAALSGVTVYANMGRVRQRSERLEAELGELRVQLPGAFADPSARDRVSGKLDEAAALLPQLKAGAREVGGSADTLISVLEEAANTVPVVAGRRKPAPPPGKPTSPAASGTRPASPSPVAAPKSAPTTPTPAPARSDVAPSTPGSP